MPKQIMRVVCAGMMVFCLGAWASGPVFHVSPKGNDAWSGTLAEPNADASDGPFATLSHARDVVRALSSGAGLAEGATVNVHAGDYLLAEPLTFGARDSGVANAPVLWQAPLGETVRLIGGMRVAEPAKEETGVLTADLSAAAPQPFHELYCNGERQTLARWPNKGEGALPGGRWAFVAAAADDARKSAFFYAGDRPKNWASVAGVEVSIWPNYNWWQTVASVAGIDAAARRVTLAGELPYTIEPGRRFFFQNVREELDAPGEWFYDGETKQLRFLPSAPADSYELLLPQLDAIIVADGASNLAFLGFTVEVCRKDAVSLLNCTDCLFGRGVVRNTGGFAVVVKGGERVRVDGNDISHTGKGGIVLEGGDRKTLTLARHVAFNNHIHHYGEIEQTYQTAVNVNGVGNRVANNLIHDAPHIGILLTGNAHLIEYNDIHHVCMEGADNGAFYMGRDWTQRGNILRGNRIHDISGFGMAGMEDGVVRYESPFQAWGIYLDDCSSGTLIEANMIYRVPLCGVMIGGGRDNWVVNNVFYECIPALHIDARWDAYCWDVMKERLDAVNPSQPPYSVWYPELNQMGDDPRKPANNHFERNIVSYTADDYRGLSTMAPAPESAVLYELDQFDPESTVFKDNCVYHYGKDIRIFSKPYKQDKPEILNWADWMAKGFDGHSLSLEKEPTFADAAGDNFMLELFSTSIEERGYRNVKGTFCGLVETELRASWPPPDETRRDAPARREWTFRLNDCADGAF